MKQYAYTDVIKRPYYFTAGLQTTVDQTTLEVAIPGYQTISVDGRGLVGRDIQTSSYQFVRAGGKTRRRQRSSSNLPKNKLLDSRLSSRTLRIRFELQADTDEQLRRRWEDLNALVNVVDEKFIFSDDPNYYYVGTLSDAEEAEEGMNHVFSSFSVECVDPYKYSVALYPWHFVGKGSLQTDYPYPVVLEKAELTAGTMGKSLVLLNETQGLSIRIDKNITVGEKVVLDFREYRVYDGSGRSIMPSLNLLSDFEGFSISSGDTIKANLQSDVVFHYREKRL